AGCEQAVIIAVPAIDRPLAEPAIRHGFNQRHVMLRVMRAEEMRAGGGDLRAFQPRAGAGADGGAVERGAPADSAYPALAEDGLVDDTEDREAVVHQCDQRAEDRPPDNEAARPVYRIEHPGPAGAAFARAELLPLDSVLGDLGKEYPA